MDRIRKLAIVPVSVRLFAETASLKSKQKAAFLVCVLLPLAFGLNLVLFALTLGFAVLVANKPLDVQLSRYVAPDKHTLFQKLREAGRAEEALQLKGLSEYERILCLRSIAKENSILGKKAEAVKVLSNARDLMERLTFIPKVEEKVEDPGTRTKVMELADTLNDLATAMQEIPGYDKNTVCGLFEEAIRLGSAASGRSDPQVTMWIINLGIFKQQELSDLTESLKLYEEALLIRKRVLGEDDPLVAQWMVNMVYLLLARPDTDKIGLRIEQLAQEALAIRKRLYGDDHVDVAASLNDCALAAALTANDDVGGLEKARAYGVESAMTYERVLGKNHPTTLKAKVDWGL